MDIALAVEEIYMGADWRRCDDYEILVRTWHDERPVPTFEELEDAWEQVQYRLADEDDENQITDMKRASIVDATEFGKLSTSDQIEYLRAVLKHLIA